MRRMQLTLAGRIMIFILIIGIVGGGLWFTGIIKMPASKPTASKPASSAPVVSSQPAAQPTNNVPTAQAKSGVITISLDEWVGWKPIVDANGGLETKPGSIYDKLGIKVVINIINDATQSSTALISNKLNGAGYTINRLAFLYPKFKENNVPVVVPFINNGSNGGDGIVSKKDIPSVEGLVGKSIGIPRFSEAQTLVEWLLAKSSLTPDQVKQIKKIEFDTPDDAAKAFFAGKVDAAATWQPYLSQAQESAGAKVLFSTKAATNLVLDGVVFRKDFYDANKETVQKFIQGAIEAASMYDKDMKAIKASMPLFATEEDANIKAMTGDARLVGAQENVKMLGDGVVQALYIDMCNIWKGIGEKTVAEDVDKIFDATLVKNLVGKVQDTAVVAPKFTQEQKEVAQKQDNSQALLKQTLSIQFDPDMASIRPESLPALTKFANDAKLLNGAIIQIVGHISSDKDDEAGVKLSQARAKSVATFLQTQGVDPNRFIIEGKGGKQPLAPNNSDANMAKNRRTEIFFKVSGY